MGEETFGPARTKNPGRCNESSRRFTLPKPPHSPRLLALRDLRRSAEIGVPFPDGQQNTDCRQSPPRRSRYEPHTNLEKSPIGTEKTVSLDRGRRPSGAAKIGRKNRVTFEKTATRFFQTSENPRKQLAIPVGTIRRLSKNTWKSGDAILVIDTLGENW